MRQRIYNIHNSKDSIEYRVAGLLHRPNGPAWCDKNGGNWGWWLNGSYHRYYGPVGTNGRWCVHDTKIK